MELLLRPLEMADNGSLKPLPQDLIPEISHAAGE